MSPRLVPPLTVLVLLAGTAVASASNPVSTPNPKMNLHCTGSEMSADGLRAKNSLESSVIGGIRIGSIAEDAVIRRSETDRPVLLSAGGKQPRPYMVAALEMASSPAQGGTPATCYPGLSLATNSVPTATAGSSYSVTLVANGGQPPYSWSFGKSSLPQGFSLGSDGDLTGTPSKAGTYAFGVIVTDSLKTAMTGSLTLTVLADNDPPPTQPPPTQPPPTQPPPTQPPPTQPPPTQPPPTQPPPTQPPPTQPPPTQPPPTQPPPTQPPPTQPPPTQPPPTQPPPTQPPPTQPPTGTALSACGPITKSGSYYLANDVSSAGTCFPLGANSITLNLNGHTITYGTGGGSAPTPAFSGCSSWYTGLTAAQCLGAGGNLTVYGGTIVQASNAAPFSPVFWMGQGDGPGGGYIHDLTTTFQSVGSQFFHGEIDGGGYKIQNNVINDNVTNIQHPGQAPLGARGQFQGYVIHTDEESTGTPPPDDISGNTFNGSPQGGVADGVAGSQIYNNTINLTSYYSNDYGVIVTMNNQNVHDNTIAGRGRGLDGESSGFILNHNTINVAETANNSEYDGCEGGGTYGIRVKNYDWPNSTESGAVPSTNFQITNNNVTVPATVCESNALDLTDMNSLVSGTISGNTFSAPAGAGGTAAGLMFNAIDSANITLQGNTFAAPTCVLIGGGGDIPYGSYTVRSGQTWSCPAGPTIVAQDDTYQQTPSNPPVITIQDSIPNPTVSCVAYSTASVTIGGSFSYTCSLKGQ